MEESDYAKILKFMGRNFYFTGFEDDVDGVKNRVYVSLDELHHLRIVTAPHDYDGALIGQIDELFREDDDDDLIRYFDSITGIEED